MTEEQAFLQAIIEAPSDNTPRLIYADWLDDHGQAERGELIRVQCELANLPEDDPRRADLIKRQRRLLRPANRTAWEAQRPDFAGKGAFVRGFLMPSLKEDVTRFLARKARDFGPFPLWQFTLTGLANSLKKDQLIEKLVACPHLLRAGGLSLSADAMRETGARIFATCPHLLHVTHLNLLRNWVQKDGMQALAESANWPRVTHLNLGGNWMADEGAAALASAPFLAHVVELDLHFNWLRDGAAQALARSPYLGRLRTLILYENAIGDLGAGALANASWVRGLRSLSIANQMTDAGGVMLARSPYLDNLEELNVSDNHRMGAPGCRALRERFGKRVILPWRHR